MSKEAIATEATKAIVQQYTAVFDEFYTPAEMVIVIEHILDKVVAAIDEALIDERRRYDRLMYNHKHLLQRVDKLCARLKSVEEGKR